MSSNILLDRIRGMLAGVVIGDSLGVPVETMTEEAISKLSGGVGVIGYMDPKKTRKDCPDDVCLYSYSDDWQMTKVVANSLIKCNGYNGADMAESHLHAMSQSTFGWGRGSIKSLQEIASGQRRWDQPIIWRSTRSGCGNGVIMKISPLAICAILTRNYQKLNTLDSVLDTVMSLAAMTHSDPRAGLSAMPVIMMMTEVLRSGRFARPESVYEVCIEFLIELEKAYNLNDNLLSKRLKVVDISTVDSLIISAGTGFTAWETACFALGVYRRHTLDFTSAILEAVNAGGDTDTNASVVGAIVGGAVGLSGIDAKWLVNPHVADAIELADNIYKRFT